MNKSKNQIMKLKLMSKFFKGFADYNRLFIFECLLEGEKTVSEIVKKTGFSQSKVSNHLKCLRECERVTTNKEGKYILYNIADDRIKEIISLSKDLIENQTEEKYNCMKY